MDLRHKEATDVFNRDVIDILLVQNFGPDSAGTIFCVPTSLADEKRRFLQKVYMEALKLGAEIDAIDTDSAKDLLGVPKRSPEEIAEAARKREEEAERQEVKKRVIQDAGDEDGTRRKERDLAKEKSDAISK